MDFRILGPLEVLDEGRDVAPRRAKQRALLILLLLHRNQLMATDRLIDSLWGEAPCRATYPRSASFSARTGSGRSTVATG